MPFTARVFRTLESELNRTLAFSFSIADVPGQQGHTTRLVGGFRFTVRVRNNSMIQMKSLRGSIAPASGARFRVTAFEITSLGAHQEVEVATIDARTADGVTVGSVLDRIATVTVAGQADLSDFWFRDQGRALSFAQPSPRLCAPASGEPSREQARPRMETARYSAPDRMLLALRRLRSV